MRLYSPEWDAIKDYAYTPRFVDVQYDLQAAEIPADHGFALFEALSAALPWFGATAGVGVHPIHGAPTGRDENIMVNRRVKLVLRVPVERVADAKGLEGSHLAVGAKGLQIGVAREKNLMPFATLYAPMVDFGTADEVEFIEAARRELEAMDIRCGLIPGKKRKMHFPDGDVWGFSLMLHDVSPEQSLKVQEEGLGRHRMQGCGLFVPHKSIKEVAVD